jgi:hypothetical protein
MYFHDPFHEGPELAVEPVEGASRTWRLTLTDPEGQWSVGEDLAEATSGATLTLTVPEGSVLYVDDGDEGRLIE